MRQSLRLSGRAAPPGPPPDGPAWCSNAWDGRIPDDGFLLFSSVPYEDIGVDRARAVLKSRFMARFAADVVRESHPDLAARMTVRKTVLNGHSRTVEALDR